MAMRWWRCVGCALAAAPPLAAGDAPAPGWIALFGRLHLVVLHFPIALLVAALALDVMRRRARRPAPGDSTAMMTWLGAASAVVVSAMGLVYAANEDFRGGLIVDHRNLGLIATGLALVAAGLCWWTRHAPHAARDWGFRIALALSVLAIACGAHKGGQSVHGKEFIDEVAPWRAPQAAAPAQ